MRTEIVDLLIQAVLREEEWPDADREFYRVAREELETYRTVGGRPSPRGDRR